MYVYTCKRGNDSLKRKKNQFAPDASNSIVFLFAEWFIRCKNAVLECVSFPLYTDFMYTCNTRVCCAHYKWEETVALRVEELLKGLDKNIVCKYRCRDKRSLLRLKINKTRIWTCNKWIFFFLFKSQSTWLHVLIIIETKTCLLSKKKKEIWKCKDYALERICSKLA